MSFLHRWLRSLVMLLCLAWSTPHTARADSEAQRLVDEALDDMNSAEFGIACPKLAKSLALEPKSGTQISLASCLDMLGKRGAAWHHYREAARLARAENRPDHVEKATLLASKLEPALAPLRVTFGSPPGLVAKIDGLTLDPERSEIFVEMGPHTITATAKGHKPFKTTIEVPASGASLDVPALQPRATPQQGPPPEQESPIRTRESSLVVAGGIVTLVGGGGLLCMFITGGLALEEKATVERACDLARGTCSEAGLEAASGAKNLADITTIFASIGLVATAVGVPLLVVGLLNPPNRAPVEATLRTTGSGASLTITGSFL